MNSFLVPANSKKGTLILNLFTGADLILFGTGIGISLLLLVLNPNTTDTLQMIGILSPAGITGMLVFPIPNYHNVRTALYSMYKFWTKRRRFIWKGWCFYERFIEERNAQENAK